MKKRTVLRMHIGLLILFGVLALGGITAARAQDEAAKAAPQVAMKEQKMTLWQLIVVGGWCMWPLGACSIAAVGFIIRNLLVLKEDKLLRPDLVPMIQQQMANQDVAAAYELCRSDSTLLTAVLSAGLERITSDEIEIDVIKEAIEEAGTEQMMLYMTPISYLTIIAAISPMLGLLGTVSGMIKAFHNISIGGMGKAEQLAANIGEALITTAAGLIIAIPAMLFFFYFKNKFMRIMASASRICGTLLDTLKTGQMPALLGTAPATPAEAGAAATEGEGAKE